VKGGEVSGGDGGGRGDDGAVIICYSHSDNTTAGKKKVKPQGAVKPKSNPQTAKQPVLLSVYV